MTASTATKTTRSRRTAKPKSDAPETTGVSFVLPKVKDTKGTVVFGTDDEDAPVRSLYVKKGAGFDDAEQITVTLS